MFSIVIRFGFFFLFIISCQIKCPEIIKPYVPFDFSKEVIVKNGYGYTLDGIVFPSNQIGYISGSNGAVLKSIDGGATFTALPSLGAYFFRDVDFINENVGIVAGSVNALFYTNDGGANWSYINTPDSIQNVERAIMISSTEFYLVGGKYSELGAIYYTQNKGVTWKRKFSCSGGIAYDLEMLSSGRWIVPTGAQKIFYSVNQGVSWAESTVAWNGSDTTNIVLADIKMVNNNLGYCSGVNRSTSESFLLKTTDGGLNWDKLAIPSTPNTEKDYLYTIFTLGDKEVFVAGGQFINNTSRLMYSPDAGQTWQIDSTFLSNSFIKEITIKNGVLYGVGQYGLIFSK